MQVVVVLVAREHLLAQFEQRAIHIPKAAGTGTDIVTDERAPEARRS